MQPSSLPDLVVLVADIRREREAHAAAVRLLPSRGPRFRTAVALRRLADRLAPAPSGAPADHRLAHR